MSGRTLLLPLIARPYYNDGTTPVDGTTVAHLWFAVGRRALSDTISTLIRCWGSHTKSELIPVLVAGTS